MSTTNHETEPLRRNRLAEIGCAVESDNQETERKRLEGRYGPVWDTEQLSAEFEVMGFMAPYVVVRRKSDGRQGSLEFQHHPRREHLTF